MDRLPPSELDRRSFIAQLGQYGAGACAVCGVAGLPASALGAPPTNERAVDFFKSLPGTRVQCLVCPLHCELADGERCFCRTRVNRGGRLITTAYNNPCVVRVDPVEKMPLSHFRPGSHCITVGVGGCNLRCVYCQNWRESQENPEDVGRFNATPAEIVDSARRREIDTIAFNYTEPVAFLEYADDIAVRAKRAGMRVICATAAHVDPEPLLKFAKNVDAFVITIKGWTDAFYREALGIRLAPILTAIRAVRHETDAWLELVNLIVPGRNDDPVQIRQMCSWIRHYVGSDVPLHFARMQPAFQLDKAPQTPVGTLERARSIAKRVGMQYVYLTNVAPHPATSTICARCDTVLINRRGFDVLSNAINRGRCPNCRTPVPGVWN